MLLILERIGNWNPQLFREIKGRLNFRNAALVVSASLLGQLFLIGIFSDHYNNDSFTMQVDGWLNIFRTLNLILPMALVLGGSYMLISDMSQEQRRGTLNFIRLTPQSSQVILIGKMLGVPVLIYLATVLALPLHLWAAICASVPLSLVFTFDLMVVAICSLFYSAAIFYTMLGETTPWIGTFLVVLLTYPTIIMLGSFMEMARIDNLIYFNLQWFYFPLNSTFTVALFSLLSICLATYGIWQFLNRRFHNPNATIISKSQSYLLVTCTNLWMLGFGVTQIGSDSSYPPFIALASFLYFLAPFCFLILIAALSPHRQSLQDWARYRGEMNHGKRGKNKIFSAFPVGLQDLIFGEKSPVIIAIAINLAITAIIWIPGIIIFSSKLFYWGDQSSIFKTSAILGIAIATIISANFILICAAIAQFMLLIKTQKPQLWASATVATVIILPIMIALLSSAENNPIWLFSPFSAIALPNASITAILSTIIAQWGILAIFSLQLTRQLRKIGESASKAMLTSRPSLPPSR
ncbi:hypothetical protein BCD67_07865 [Oscillatoriales cyanobacterium USR001]|nr:hypothetical protein BCD67_07865 [Oscillatoriales cyanobacterium USR001]